MKKPLILILGNGSIASDLRAGIKSTPIESVWLTKAELTEPDWKYDEATSVVRKFSHVLVCGNTEDANKIMAHVADFAIDWNTTFLISFIPGIVFEPLQEILHLPKEHFVNAVSNGCMRSQNGIIAYEGDRRIMRIFSPLCTKRGLHKIPENESLLPYIMRISVFKTIDTLFLKYLNEEKLKPTSEKEFFEGCLEQIQTIHYLEIRKEFVDQLGARISVRDFQKTVDHLSLVVRKADDFENEIGYAVYNFTSLRDFQNPDLFKETLDELLEKMENLDAVEN